MASDVVTDLDLDGVRRVRRGKVREVFDLGDRLLFVATDRISAFDCILPDGIPDKGRVLNGLSAWWFARTRDIVPNHVLDTSLDGLPPALRGEAARLEGRAMVVRKAEVLPIECVVRGYLAGSGWKAYRASGTIAGEPLRPGYRLADRLDAPIFTPASKAESGHDENIAFEETARRIGRARAEALREASLALYRRAADLARERGLIIADTKFEFGLVGGRLTLVDEALTPDSSRFWAADTYQPGASPPSFDKQYVRDHLEATDWDKRPPAPRLPAEVIARTRAKYLEAYRRITGADLPGTA